MFHDIKRPSLSQNTLRCCYVYKAWCIDTTACINTQDHQVSIATNSPYPWTRNISSTSSPLAKHANHPGKKAAGACISFTIVEMIQDKERANTGRDARIPRPNSNPDSNWGHRHGETPAANGASDLSKCYHHLHTYTCVHIEITITILLMLDILHTGWYRLIYMYIHTIVHAYYIHVDILVHTYYIQTYMLIYMYTHTTYKCTCWYTCTYMHTCCIHK